MTTDSRIDVLGVAIDPLSFDAAVATILGWLEEDAVCCRYVVTPNINHLILHNEQEEFRQAYSGASLVLADGRYVSLIARFLTRQRIPEPVNGSDLVPRLIAAAEPRGGFSVFLLGAMEGVAEEAGRRIAALWPNATIAGVYSPAIGFENCDVETAKILATVNDAAPDLLVVGISPPKQEIWVSRHAGSMNVKVAVCAGATIDFLAGKVPRAPRWMQKAGMEWLFRTCTEPRRLAPRYLRDSFAVLKLLVRRLWGN